MSKVELKDVTNLKNPITPVVIINGNSAAITTAIENTLSRDGTSPNEMLSQLDMNSNRIINLPTPVQGSEPVRLVDLANFLAGDSFDINIIQYFAGSGLNLDIPTHTFSISDGGVTNAMLAGSITSSKLVGTDITTIGTISTGTVPVAHVSGLSAIATSGSASDLITGTVATGRIAGSYTGITGIGTLTVGSIPVALVTGLAPIATSGSGTDITSGTIADAHLPAIISTKTFTGTTTFTGLLHLPNNVAIQFRNAANSVDFNALYMDTSNVFQVGGGAITNISSVQSTASPTTGALTVAGGLGVASSIYVGALIHLPNNVPIAARNVGNSADINVAYLDTSDVFQIGGGDNVAISATQSSSSSSTGALQVAGGIYAGAQSLFASYVGIGAAPIAGNLTLTAAGQASFFMKDTIGVATHKVGKIIYDGGETITGGGWIFQKADDSGNFVANLVTIVQDTGFVAIGGQQPSTILDVAGVAHFYPSGTTPDNSYNGQVRITKPVASGQYINMVRTASAAWSIGYVYNTSNFAIGAGQTTDSNFTAPFLTITAAGDVGIGTTGPGAKLEVSGSVLLPNNTGYQAKQTGGTATNVLYIDGSNVAQVGGGLPVNVNGNFFATTNANTNGSVRITNSSAGSSAVSALQALNDVNNSAQFVITSSGFSPIGSLTANAVAAYSDAPGGLVLISNNGSGPIVFSPGGLAERARFAPDGSFGMSLTNPATIGSGTGIAIGVVSGVGTIAVTPYVDSNLTTSALVVQVVDQPAANTNGGHGYEYAIIGGIKSTHNDHAVSFGPNKVGVAGMAELSGATSGNGWGGYFLVSLDSGSSSTSAATGVEIDCINSTTTDRNYSNLGSPSYGLQLTGTSNKTNTAALLISGQGRDAITHIPTGPQWYSGIVFNNSYSGTQDYGIDFAFDSFNTFGVAAMRLPNNQTIAWKQSGGTNTNCLYLDSSNIFQLGGGLPIHSASTTASSSTITGAITTAGGIGVAGTIYTGGLIHLPNNTALSARNVANSLDVSIIYLDTSDVCQIGGGDPVHVASTTASTSSTTGSFTTAGGAGIAGAVQIAGALGVGVVTGTYGGSVINNITASVSGGYPLAVINSHGSTGDAALIIGAGLSSNVGDSSSVLIDFRPPALGSVAGTITRNGTNAVAYNTSSDVRGKTNKELLTAVEARRVITALRIWDFDKEGNEIRGVGVIAQEAYEVNKTFAYKPVDPDSWWGAEKAAPVPFLIRNMQEANERLDLLERELEELKAYIKERQNGY